MKIAKRFLLITFLAVPLFMVPKQSHAGIIGDILGLLFGNGKGQNGQGGQKKDPPPTTTSNSVPVDGGTVVLLMAGLGLGTWMLLRSKPKISEVEIATAAQ